MLRKVDHGVSGLFFKYCKAKSRHDKETLTVLTTTVRCLLHCIQFKATCAVDGHEGKQAGKGKGSVFQAGSAGVTAFDCKR